MLGKRINFGIHKENFPLPVLLNCVSLLFCHFSFRLWLYLMGTQVSFLFWDVLESAGPSAELSGDIYSTSVLGTERQGLGQPGDDSPQQKHCHHNSN
jgi:hypothetical protein